MKLKCDVILTSICRYSLLLIIVCFGIISCLLSCDDSRSNKLCREVDSLNLLAYKTRFICLDTTEKYSKMAYEKSVDYKLGKAEALGNLAFVQYMRMDYDSSSVLYHKSYDMAPNLIIKSMADVGLMKICQITGKNEELYDYSNEAEAFLKRVDEDLYLLTPTQMMQRNYALSEYHLSMSSYYNHIMQEDQEKAELDAIASNMSIVEDDSAQLSRFWIIKGDYERGLEIARRSGNVYMYASALEKLADKIQNDDNISPADTFGPSPLEIAQKSLRLFREYGSIYSQALAYLTISESYVRHGQPEVALDTATKALEFVNIQHMRLYGDDAHFLVPYSFSPDSISTEMLWMKKGSESCAWDWIASIREQLSIIYSSMGMKPMSDYNRNIYLDIQQATRKDKKLENQLETLQREEAQQNILVIVVSIFILLLVVGIYIYVKHLRKRTEKKYEQDIVKVEDSFKRWMTENETIYSSMDEEEKKIDSETYIHEQHIAENKRSYIDKCTSLSLVYGITPFLDRAINEISKLKTSKESDDVKKERITYLSELIDRINLYNEVLAHWIKVRQGMVNLNIENFSIQPLLDTLAKNKNTFQNKGLTLDVESSSAIVKADKALTLFMMNTLLDNARKYTPEGGAVKIDAKETEEYVEISVTDSGKGLSDEDIKTICTEKVYDSSKIGDVEHDKDLKQNKGFGFGLMNCKGIIDKYKKTNPLFSVCLFNIESEIGKGSRFYFRLPKGVMKALVLLLMFIPSLMIYAQSASFKPYTKDIHVIMASQYADSVYYANIDGLYEKALFYADSALYELNEYYLEKYPDATNLLTLVGDNYYPELEWWAYGFETNYSIILDVRNESAIAALALQLMDIYRYNNDIYFKLNRLTTQDNTIEQNCAAIHDNNITRQTVFIILILAAVIGIILFLIIYYRVQLLPTFNMRQLMQFNKKLFTEPIPNMLDFVYNGLYDIKQVEGIAIATKSSDDGTIKVQTTNNCPFIQTVESLASRSLATGEEMSVEDGKVRSYPLIHENINKEDEDDAESVVVGALAVVYTSPSISSKDDEIVHMMVQRLATYIYYSATKVEDQKTAILLKEDEKYRAEKEENTIHIQNMVLDNCLSAIKHETMYYPSRIKNILEELKNEGREGSSTSTHESRFSSLDELILYYKEVFTLLSSCAARQLDNVMFKRKNIPLSAVAQYAKKSMKRQMKKSDADVEFIVDDVLNMQIVGDEQMIEYLIDNLIAASLQCQEDGEIRLSFGSDDGFVKIVYKDNRQKLSEEELSNLFYPEHLKYDEEDDKLIGVEYLVCRQIVREHDEYGGRRGCRIIASQDGDGYKIEIMLNEK